MARFYGEVSGSAKTTATRMGTPSSGINGHIRGWDCGIEVDCFVGMNDNDVCVATITGGSNATFPRKKLATIKMNGDSREILVNPDLSKELDEYDWQKTVDKLADMTADYFIEKLNKAMSNNENSGSIETKPLIEKILKELNYKKID
jgi:hypothetical protein